MLLAALTKEVACLFILDSNVKKNHGIWLKHAGLILAVFIIFPKLETCFNTHYQNM